MIFDPGDREITLPIVSAVVVASYHFWLALKVRSNPRYTIQSLLNEARIAWVARMMSGNEGILAVQTLRNAIMGATFFASTAIALIVGTITLSVQGDRLTQIWASVGASGAASAAASAAASGAASVAASGAIAGPIDQHLWLIKIMLLLIDMMCAFIFFAQAIRLNAHVGVLISVPKNQMDAGVVADLFIRAGRFHTRGMRCYYLAGPLMFWLFGPVAMLAASIALVIVLYFLDRSPLLRKPIG